MKLGIFIPAYQAEKTLESVFLRIPEPLWEAVEKIWVIDDGSTDATSAIGKRWSLARSSLAVHRFESNQGYGAAVKQGLKLCLSENCSHAVCLHADGQYPPEEVLTALALLQKSEWDLLQGSRHQGGTARKGGMPLYKIVAGRSLTWLENRCFKWKLTDYHSGFLVYGPRALQHIPFDSLSGYFDFDLEVIATACAKGFNVGEMAIPTRYADEMSHLQPIRYGFRVLAVLSRFLRGHYARL